MQTEQTKLLYEHHHKSFVFQNIVFDVMLNWMRLTRRLINMYHAKG